ncbi:hypothetical protein MF625_001031 [Paenibacillus polymyxa]|uniref:hypothetical protein n=1 Tax=Paenibacillus polymyxa TaxID=1406 RepID=UPI002025127C|nr:hypothetical protein [Paenibacillus polymyxa]URJ36612.1 hypothetical protein MF625_001031 [Paenibacillus polymyxa]
MEIDRKARDGKSEEYEDPDFDEWARETEEMDSKLSYDYSSSQTPAEDPGDWEDVEP